MESKMSRKRAYVYPKNPFDNPKEDNWVIRHWNPTTLGSATALALVVTSYRGIKPEWSIFNGSLPSSVIVAASGFAFGYSTATCLEWIRWRLVKRLFEYQGWITNPGAMKTKMWAFILGILEGPSRKTTYFYQRLLPKQPLPNLNDTLDRWLAATKMWVSPEEWLSSKEAVEQFRVNEGPKIQEYLLHRAEKEVSWIADYWLAAAYLSSRESLAINNNYQISSVVPAERCSDMLTRAASYTHYLAKFEDLLSTGRLDPVMLQNLVPLCMHGYRYIYNVARLPGEHIDRLESYPGNWHIVVMRNGRYFKVQMYPEKRSKSMLSVKELREQYRHIVNMADEESCKPLPVASLSAQRRPTWAKHRELLKKSNSETLMAIESAMFLVCLDDKVPVDLHDYLKTLITGNGYDRWFDKSFTNVTFGDGSNGSNVEHTGIDATVFMTLAEYATVMEEYEDGHLPSGTRVDRISLPPPEELTWNLSGLEDIVNEADTAYSQMMAMALAIYRLHNTMPKTYEPSTGRLFIMGRTETVHPMTEYSGKWIRAMDDSSVYNSDKIELLKKAVRCQTKYRMQATIGKGCDRHLLALYCASREMGMDIPNIFMDKTWRMPFILSTSQTPTRIYEYMPPKSLNYDGLTGSFGPSCHDGYGCSYGFLGDDYAHVAITSWHSSSETNSKQFGMAIGKALDDMKFLLTKSHD